MQDSEAVTLWRNRFRLNLSKSWKADVDITVTDIELWKSILAGWKWQDTQGRWHKKHPGIKGLLTEYERLEMKKNELRAKAISARSGQSIPTRPMGRVPDSLVPSLPKGTHGFKG